MKTRTEVIIYLFCVLLIPTISVIREGWSVLKEMNLWFIVAGSILILWIIANLITKAKDKRIKRAQDAAIKKYYDTHSG